MAKNFWELSHPDRRVALVDARNGKVTTFADLRADVARVVGAFPKWERRSLGLLLTANRPDCVATYLAALQMRSALILIDGGLAPDLLDELVRTYRPDWIAGEVRTFNHPGYREIERSSGILQTEAPEDLELHPDLAILLSTSGSTGSPKLVRLTPGNLQANAESIAEYLQLTAEERPVTSLQMAYSYGLSVINSHLLVGATLVLTDSGVLQREFWEVLDRHSCSSLSGVPYTYEMLLKTGLLRSRGQRLKTLTQAGGRLAEEHTCAVRELAAMRNAKFFVMYGQTEATARISYVPYEQLNSKIGSVGIPIPGGLLSIEKETEELIYRGPNVMMGYAECREDLAKGDELKGILKTGDLARQDGDGYFYLTGRSKRFLKLFGKRFNLEDMERLLAQRLASRLACCGRDDLLIVALERPHPDTEMVTKMLCKTYGLPSVALKVLAVDEIPRTPNGKVDYRTLTDGEAFGA